MNSFLISKGTTLRFNNLRNLQYTSETDWLQKLVVLKEKLGNTSFLNSINSWLSFTIDTENEGSDPKLILIEENSTRSKVLLQIKIDIDEKSCDKIPYFQIKLYDNIHIAYVMQIIYMFEIHITDFSIISPYATGDSNNKESIQHYFIDIVKDLKNIFHYCVDNIPSYFDDLDKVSEISCEFSHKEEKISTLSCDLTSLENNEFVLRLNNSFKDVSYNDFEMLIYIMLQSI